MSQAQEFLEFVHLIRGREQGQSRQYDRQQLSSAHGLLVVTRLSTTFSGDGLPEVKIGPKSDPAIANAVANELQSVVETGIGNH